MPYRRKPRPRTVPFLELPREQCRCGAEFVIQDGRFPDHQEGDLPTWIASQRCGMSGKPVRRRKPKPKGRWHDRLAEWKARE